MHRALILALTLAACATEPTVEPASAPVVVAPDIDAQMEHTTQTQKALVPSPSETQKALEAAGIDVTLASLIEHPTLSMASDSEDQLAVSAGVVVADLILTAKTSTIEQLTSQLDTIQLAMKQLEGGSDIDRMLTDLRARVATESITRDELVSELEMLSSAVIPELEFNGRARIVPLIQAGSWLEASNLLARALKDADRPAVGDGLIKQPEVVAYFQRYAMDHGMDSPAPMIETLIRALDSLAAVANKDGPLTDADLETVAQSTQAVLALL